MHASSNPNRIIRFGVFEVDLQEAELRQSGLRQKLSPQAFEVLRAMLERPGELITREELRERLWTGNTTVDYELGSKSASIGFARCWAILKIILASLRRYRGAGIGSLHPFRNMSRWHGDWILFASHCEARSGQAGSYIKAEEVEKARQVFPEPACGPDQGLTQPGAPEPSMHPVTD